MFYAHYDGQPVNPPDWKQPTPFTPILRDGRLEDGGHEVPGLGTLATFKPEWRIYGRSASDDKAPIVALMAALDALKASGLAPSSNIHLILDGEEEASSPSLVPAVIPAYTVFNFSSEWYLTKNVRLIAGVSNLADEKYYSRVFLNGLIEPAPRRTGYADASGVRPGGYPPPPSVLPSRMASVQTWMLAATAGALV